jgi:hypothetical protein
MKGTCSFRFFQAGQRKKLHLDSLQWNWEGVGKIEPLLVPQNMKHRITSLLLRHYLSFSSLSKIPERNNSKEKRFVLAYSFRGLGPRLAGSMVWAWGGAEHHGGLTSWWPGSRETAKGEDKTSINVTTQWPASPTRLPVFSHPLNCTII